MRDMIDMKSDKSIFGKAKGFGSWPHLIGSNLYCLEVAALVRLSTRPPRWLWG